MAEIWPVLAAAAALGLLGLVALAYTDRMSAASWLLALLVALGVAGFMFPRIHEINQGVIDSGEFLGIAQGVGIWAIGGGIAIGLLAGAAGWGAARRASPQSGLTLIQAVIAVMIVGAAAAVAIPKLLNQANTQATFGAPAWTSETVESPTPAANPIGSVGPDRAAQMELRSALLAEKAYWLETGDYTDDAASIKALDPALDIATSPRAGVTLTLSETDSDRVCITRTSESGYSFSVWEDASAGTYYGTSDLSGSCPATPPASYAMGGW